MLKKRQQLQVQSSARISTSAFKRKTKKPWLYGSRWLEQIFILLAPDTYFISLTSSGKIAGEYLSWF